MPIFDKLINSTKAVVKSIAKTGEALGVQAYRKSKKPFRQYMAPERAEKFLEEQQKVPKRAPMNLPKIKIPHEDVEASKIAVQEILKKSDELLKNLKDIKVVSRDPPGDLQDGNVKPKPQLKTAKPVAHSKEVPRGLLRLGDLIDVLHNHKLAPVDWSSKEIAEKFKLREEEVDGLLKHFHLVEEKDKST